MTRIRRSFTTFCPVELSYWITYEWFDTNSKKKQLTKAAKNIEAVLSKNSFIEQVNAVVKWFSFLHEVEIIFSESKACVLSRRITIS